MAQAQAFETDFWKDANLRKVWDDIVPGEPRKTPGYFDTMQISLVRGRGFTSADREEGDEVARRNPPPVVE